MTALACLLMSCWVPVAIAAQPSGRAPGSPTLAILDLEPLLSSTVDAASLADMVREEAVNAGTYRIVESDQKALRLLKDSMFQATGFEQSEGLPGEPGPVVDFLATGSYGYLGAQCYLWVDLLDTKGRRIVKTVQEGGFSPAEADPAVRRLMRKLLIPAVQSGVMPKAASAVQPNPVLCVMDLEPVGAPAGDAIVLSNILRYAAGQLGTHRVVDRATMDRALKEHQFQQIGTIPYTSPVELGALMGARKALLGKCTLYAGTPRVSVRLVDTKTGVTERAESSTGFASADAAKVATVLLRKLLGKQVPAGHSPALKTNLWALCIGVSKYRDAGLSLQFADFDASQFGAMLKSQEGRLFGEVHVQVLLNGQVTRKEVLSKMKHFLGQASVQDVVVIFLSGHGRKDATTDAYYFMTYDSTAETLSEDALRWTDFEDSARKIRANVSKLLVFNDSCHSGALELDMGRMTRGGEAGEDLAEASKQLRQAEGTYVLSASRAGESSLEDAAWKLPGEKRGHGAFTYALLTGLQGEADLDMDGVIQLFELNSYVTRMVARISDGSQHPHNFTNGEDLPVGVRR
ncbi:MAG: caspase family protein [Candidatus Coatesbacteria bacterium]